ncbi:MAG TPA: site-specific DNA-methyltransferase [Planctomycetaceae bacterium]|jgi:site-specific DNA-methyltransferase (adenine-specific)
MRRSLFSPTNFDHRPFCLNGLAPVFATDMGVLFKGDCLKTLSGIKPDIADLIFADPPFNIGKEYGASVNDSKTTEEYLAWCKAWIDECTRVLKPGGSFFLYNIPKWNIQLGDYMMKQGLHFRDWIAVDIKFGLPLQGRLYPSHYSLLYYSKGRHKTFHNIRTPIKLCRHCSKEVKDYGGHRNAMNPKGVNLTDVWDDIPPVRHWKFKTKKRKANALSTKLLQRVIHMASDKDDVILDPFGGSGTTYAVAERMGRRWIGIDLKSTDIIIERMQDSELHQHPTSDVLE